MGFPQTQVSPRTTFGFILRRAEAATAGYLVFPKASHWEIYRKTSQLTLHPHIRWAEPHFLGEATPAANKFTSVKLQRFATFEAACGPAPVSLQILPRLPQSFQISFSHPIGEFIIFEAAPDLMDLDGLHKFSRHKISGFQFAWGTGRTFIRAIHQ